MLSLALQQIQKPSWWSASQPKMTAAERYAWNIKDVLIGKKLSYDQLEEETGLTRGQLRSGIDLLLTNAEIEGVTVNAGPNTYYKVWRLKCK